MYVNDIVASKVVVSLTDYRDLAAINRQDLVLWNEADAQRRIDDAELTRLGRERERGN